VPRFETVIVVVASGSVPGVTGSERDRAAFVDVGSRGESPAARRFALEVTLNVVVGRRRRGRGTVMRLGRYG